MRWQDRSDDRRNGASFATAALAHVAGAYFLAVGLGVSPRQPEPDRRNSEPITFWFEADERREVRRASRKRRVSNHPDMPIPAAISTTKQRNEVAASNSLAAQSSIDWSGERTRSAAYAVDRSTNPLERSLDSKPRTIPKLEVYEKGLFDRGPAHQPGTVEDHGEGIVVTWESAYCRRISSMTFEGRVDGVRCAQSKASEGGADLFEDLKPRHLRLPLPGEAVAADLK